MVNAKLHVICGNCGSIDLNYTHKDILNEGDGDSHDGTCFKCNNCGTLHFLDSLKEEGSEINKLDALGLAVLFHATYEKLAPDFGYGTRDETKIFNPETPNGKLMVATCGEVIKYLREDGHINPNPEVE